MFKLISKPEAVPVGRPVSLKVRYIHEGKPLGSGDSLRIGYNFNDGAGGWYGIFPPAGSF